MYIPEAVEMGGTDFEDILADSSDSPSEEPTETPSFSPTWIKTKTPSASPTISSKPTFAPTTATSPVLSFNSNLTLSGLSSTTLQSSDELSVRNATATSMKISMDYVQYASTVPISSSNTQAKAQMHSGNEDVHVSTVIVKLIHLTGTSSVIAITTTTISTGSQDPTTYYNSLTSSLTSAVQSGAFTKSLQSAATSYGASVVTSANCTGVQNSSPVVVTPSGGSSSNDGLSNGEIAGIVIGVLAFLILIAAAVYYFFVIRDKDRAPLLEAMIVPGISYGEEARSSMRDSTRKSDTSKKDLAVSL